MNTQKSAGVLRLLSLSLRACIVILLVFAVFAYVASRDFSANSWHGFSTVLAFCLTGLFFLPERIDDERVRSLKLKAVSFAFGSGFLLLAWVERFAVNLFKHTLTVYDFIAFVTGIALGLFHYWRWQDGRAEKSG
jgi:carbon starvation protein CstA